MKDYLSKNNAFKLTVEDIKAIDGGASAFQVGKAKYKRQSVRVCYKAEKWVLLCRVLLPLLIM